MNQKTDARPAFCGMDFWLGPINRIRLDTFRVCLGISMLAYFGAWWQHAPEWLTDQGFHLSRAAISSFWPYFPTLPISLLPFFGILFFGALLTWTLGWKTRWSCPAALLGAVYVNGADILAAYTVNKMFIVSLAIFCCVPHDRTAPGKTVTAWPVRMFQMTLIIHYFFAGWTKIVWGDWLRDPNVLWSQVQGVYRTDLASWMLQHLPMGVWSWFQYTALTFELASPLLFSIKRLRPIGLLWGAAFQLLVALTMHQLIYFSLQMLSLYVVFLPEDTLERLWTVFKKPDQFFLALKHTVRTAMLNAFILLNLLGVMIFSNLPSDNHIRQAVSPVFTPYLNAFCLWQSWAMFSSPGTENTFMEWRITYADGTQKAGEIGRMDNRSLIEKMVGERERKYVESVFDKKVFGWCYPQLARWVIRRYARAENAKPLRVEIIRTWSTIPSPQERAEGKLSTPWRSETIYVASLSGAREPLS